MSVILTRANKKGSTRTRENCMSILRTKENKRVIINTCSLDENESKSNHISVNTSKVKDSNNEMMKTIKVKVTKNETKDEGPSVTDNSVIYALTYFKLFECVKNFLEKVDTTF